MPSAPIPPGDHSRVRELRRLGLSDLADRSVFETWVRLAAGVLRAPVAAINLVDEHEEWALACVGPGAACGRRCEALCAYTILDDDLLVVEDAAADPRFADLPQVADGRVRFYAGAPIFGPSGAAIGALCVRDAQPRALGHDDRQRLRDMARLVTHEIRALIDRRDLEAARVTLDRSSDMVFWVERSGRLRYVNDAACRALGYDRHELMDLAVPDIDACVPDDGWAALWDRVHRERSATHETRLITRDGRHVPTEILATAVEAHGEPLVCASGRDISRRRAEEDARRRISTLARKTERIARVGGWEYVVETGELFWSVETYWIHNVPLTRRPTLARAFTFYPPHHQADLSMAFDDLLQGGPTLGAEVPLNQAGGKQIWVRLRGEAERDERGAVVRINGAIQDITERRVADQRLALALDAADQGLWDWDILTGRTFFNHNWYRMLGYEPGALPMRYETWRDLVHPDDFPRADQALRDHFAGRTDRYTCELRMRTRCGRWSWILAVAEVVERDERGAPLRMIGVHIDIDWFKRIQAELESARVRAEAANHAKSEFLANMSHEIRTPMTAILGYVDLLADEADLHDDRDARLDILRTIRRNGEHLLAIISDVLDISKIEAGRMTTERVETSPARVVADVLSLMRARAEDRGLHLGARCLTPIPRAISSDPTRLRQIVLNLVGNAVKFTEHGGVDLELSLERPRDTAPTLVLAVHDTGIGITEEQMDGLFDAFFQADASTTRRFGGTGLGLSISSRLARILGGRLDVDSRPDEGSVFTLRLPLDEQCARDLVGPDGVLDRPPPVEPEDHADEPAGDRPLDGLAVLLAEDSVDSQRLLTRFLELAGAAVHLAPDGLAALRAATDARGAGRPFDLIVMDMQMPELDGYAAVRRLRAAGDDTPIIALTAHAMAGDRERCVKAGCDDYAAKPIDRRALARLCARTIARRRGDGHTADPQPEPAPAHRRDDGR